MTTSMPAQLPECKKPELKLVIWPDKFLRYPVSDFSVEQIPTRLIKDTAGAMIRAMYKHYGVGLAAQQVGVPQSMFVMDSKWIREGKKRPKIFINPKIIMADDDLIELERPGEGCLSFPYNFRSPVARRKEVLLQWTDLKGKQHEEWFTGFEAIVVQHEVDHLLGYCFYDRLSRLKQDMAFRKARKIRRHYSSGYKKMIKQMKSVTRTKAYALKRAKEFELTRKGENNVSKT